MSQTYCNMINNNETHFFEGVEKLLEVWFTRKDCQVSACDLRKIPRFELETIMKIVGCEIISSTHIEDMDAYVLSESSMFISTRRFILKTCGTTRLLHCLTKLLSMVYKYTGYDSVQDLYYSRKNFKRPDLQSTPHRTFEEEVENLGQMFSGGRAYCMGSVNGADCWYIYAVSPNRNRNSERGARQNLPQRKFGKIHEADQTLEILMTDLDQDKMKYFYKSSYPIAQEATKKSGIDKFIPGVVIDEFQFDPCGYSMNGVSKTVPGGYMTIHITPEPEFSYVSFETNIPQKCYKDLISRVVAAFGPKQFIVTFFASHEHGSGFRLENNSCIPHYSNYDAEDIQICRLRGYDLTYALYNRFPS